MNHVCGWMFSEKLKSNNLPYSSAPLFIPLGGELNKVKSQTSGGEIDAVLNFAFGMSATTP